MKSPVEPESIRALAGMRRFPDSSITDRMRRESEEDCPVNVIKATWKGSEGGGCAAGGGAGVTSGGGEGYGEGGWPDQLGRPDARRIMGGKPCLDAAPR